MKKAKLSTRAGAVALATAALMLPQMASAGPADVAQIQALEKQFAAAFNAKNVDAVMKVYMPDQSLVAFDVVPPRQYVGAAAYRKDWQNFFALFDGPVKFEISDLAIVADGNTGFSHSIQHVTGTTTKGQPLDLTVRVTHGYRKANGHWLIAHDHVSVPVDLDTLKPDLNSKP